MGVVSTLTKLRARRASGPRSDQVSARVQRLLVTTLYANPSSLAIGALAGVAAAGVAAWVSDITEIYVCFTVLTIVAIVRVGAAIAFTPQSESRSTRMLEVLYEMGAFSYALTISILAALVLWYPTPADAKIMMVANALCYGVGVACRNAGRPTIALGQLTLVCVPIIVVCLAIGSAAMIALAVTILLLVPAMMSIALNIFRTLRESFDKAEESAELAEKMRILARTDVVTGLANRAAPPLFF